MLTKSTRYNSLIEESADVKNLKVIIVIIK
jgi:hypothetical protein